MNAEAPTYEDIAEWYDAFTRSSPFNGVALRSTLRLLADVRDRSVLDLATGTGHSARGLALSGAMVTAIDISETMLAIARRHEARNPLGITYLNADARALEPFVDGSFDGVLASLCLTDIEELDRVFSAVHRVLRSTGWFAWSVPHPCFTPPGAEFARTVSGRPAKLVTGYFEEGFWRSDDLEGVRRVGAYHRTVSTYLNAFIQSGFTLQRLAEPSVTATGDRASYGEVAAFLVGVVSKP
ncbi:MAG: class I SAM-dependent methyltransferase [Candidatus Dormibacteraeota bacterium]|nr:class I SAM-dependent methyltransferase [Candidatus Dormibacteraeota bacterium]